MTTKQQSEARRLITLAQNPLVKSDEGGVEDWEDELEEGSVEKGKAVSGPRTKLASADGQIDTLVKSVSALAKSVSILAKNQSKMDTRTRLIAKALGDDMFGEYDEAADPMAVDEPDSFEDEEALSLSNGGDASGIASSETGFQSDTAGVGRDFKTGESDHKDSQFNNAVAKARVAKARKVVAKAQADGRVARTVRKDDAATSFGEKDSDVPGNRPSDQKERPEDQYILQGGTGAGPGPISKAALDNAVNSAVQKALAEAGVIRKSVAPGIGGDSTLKKGGYNTERMQGDLSKMSFTQINRVREEAGDLGKAF